MLGAEFESDVAYWCDGETGGLAGSMPVGWGGVLDGDGFLFFFCVVLDGLVGKTWVRIHILEFYPRGMYMVLVAHVHWDSQQGVC